ncbi:MAG TPA: acyltransferase [Anaeromyxobacteraceae bacterium]|nr:acyltransferase [Anaeromyxobacteraceae bacterium]
MTPERLRVPSSGDKHLPTLDGLRGVAVLLVLAFHFAHLDGQGGRVERVLLGVTGAGWSGVDLFFVLSGFLITGILLDAKGAPGYFRSFYLRRALRIFPLYYAYLAVLFVALPWVVPASVLDVKPGTQGWLWSYAGNVLYARERGFAVSPYAAHFWSLAVEEQFYLAWPFLVWVLSPRRLAVMSLALVALAFGVRFGIHHTSWNATAAYVLTPCRADALAAGALVALAVREPGGLVRLRALAPWVLAGAALAIAAIWFARGAFFGGDPVVQVWGFSALALGYGAVLVLVLSASAGSLLGRSLASRPLRAAGRYSYGLYVLHYPVFLALEAVGLGAPTFARWSGSRLGGILAFAGLAAALSLAAALLSWTLVEARFLKLKGLVPYPLAGASGRDPLAPPATT